MQERFTGINDGGAFTPLAAVAGHAGLTAGLFWTTFFVGSISTALLQFLAVGYAVVVVTARASVREGTPGAGPDTAVRYLARWGFLYPASVAVLNAVGLWLLGRVLATPALRTLPLVAAALDVWTVWDATGLLLLAILTTAAGMVAAVANVAGRLVAAMLASPES